jgi:hypothetical protein
VAFCFLEEREDTTMAKKRKPVKFWDLDAEVALQEEEEKEMESIHIGKVDYQHNYNPETKSCTVVAVDLNEGRTFEFVFHSDTIHDLYIQLRMHLPAVSD